MFSKLKKLFFILVILTCLVFIGGCSTTGDVFKSKNEGTANVYPVTKDQAWEIARRVFRWEGADAIEEHKDEGYMLTSSGINLITYGTVMGAWVDSVGNNQSRVTVVTKRRLSLSYFTTLTETTFHKRFAQGVEIINSGKSLPIEAPN